MDIARRITHAHTTLLWHVVRDHPLPPILITINILYQLFLPPSTMTYSILCVQFTCLTVLFHNLSPGPLVFLLVWGPLLRTTYVGAPGHNVLLIRFQKIKRWTFLGTQGILFACVYHMLSHLSFFCFTFSLLIFCFSRPDVIKGD